MDSEPTADNTTQAARFETVAEQQRRLAWEAEMIAEADADIAAGRIVDEAEVDAWIEQHRH